MKNFIWIALLAVCFSSCENTSKVDLLIYNAKIYTVDAAFSTAQAIAIEDGEIVAVGTNDEITGRYFSDDKINANGKFIYPGFIDAHSHFFRYGLGLQTANLVDTKSWDDILDSLQSFAKTHPDGWITGRGWDQ